MQSQYKYIEIVEGNVTNRGRYTECPHNWELDYIHYPPQADCFHSVFIHSEDIINYTDGKGGKSGYNKEVGCECLFWDIDNTDLEEAFKDTKKLIGVLINKYDAYTENIAIYYSGCKGFHILYYCPELVSTSLDSTPSFNDFIKRVCCTIGDGIESMDTHIYDRTRIIRTPNTINSKTSLYKIQVSLTKSIDEIKESAKIKQEGFFKPCDKCSAKIESLLIEQAQSSYSNKYGTKKFSQEELINGIQNGFSEGDRNTGLTSVAGLLRSRNFSPDLIYSFLCAINAASVHPLDVREVRSIVNSVNRYNPDPLYIEPSVLDIHTIEDAANKWMELRSRTSKLSSGFHHIDLELPYFDPGEVLMIAARSGCGKTTLGMQLSNGIAKGFGGYGLFASLEMPETSIFIRSVIMNLSKRNNKHFTYEEAVNTIFSDKSIVESTIKDWSNILLIDKTCLSIDQIRKYYDLANEKSNFKLTNILVDYVGLMDGTEDYVGLSKVARGLKGLAKQLNTRVICITQLSRQAKDGTVPVSIDMLRDSGALEESADYILGMWLSSKDPSLIHCSILKNRFGERGKKFNIVNTGLYYQTKDA